MKIAPSRKVAAPDSGPGLVGLGFDPGISKPGITCLRRRPVGYDLLHHKVVRHKPKTSDLERYRAIHGELERTIVKHRPSFLVIEEQAGAQVGAFQAGEFNANNGKTLQTVGLAIALAFSFRLNLVMVNPKRAKIAVLGKGSGSADKKQVQAIVARILGQELPQDSSDAAAMTIYGFQMHRNERRGAA